MTDRSRLEAVRSAAPLVLAGFLVGAALLAVVATVLLSLWWRPSVPMVDRGQLQPQLETALWVRDFHSWALLLVAVAAAALAVAGAIGRAGRRPRTVAGLAVATVVLAGAVLQARNLVLWDQVGLWAVTIGTDVRGIWWAARSDAVRFVIVGSSEVNQGEFFVVTVVSTVVLPGLMLATAAGAALLVWRRPSVEHAA